MLGGGEGGGRRVVELLTLGSRIEARHWYEVVHKFYRNASKRGQLQS